MRITPRGLFVGVWAALAAPACLRDDLHGLLAHSEAKPGKVVSDGGAEASLALSRLMLRVLAKLPGNRWRNTCLYRSVAECLALRRLGVPARLCIGVEEDDDSLDQVAAHAWVEVDGVVTASGERPQTGMARLTPRTEFGREDAT